MYNKIASIILNSGKNQNYAGEVFVAQPDSAKEKLAGKIFVLAELEGRKSDSQKIINFLVNFFDYNYYGDEKISQRDKVEGLNIENIFESVLARVNKGLLDFLLEEHLKLDPAKSNLTVGVVYENKLYFSNFGKNKAFLVYRRKGDYEIVNIETSASEGEDIINQDSDNYVGKVFSTVINGDIPEYSYFLFVNEALPEYLSNRELLNIITKLPPMVAAEQIKNSLQKINSFAPFLGIIVKSTLGLNFTEIAEEVEILNRVAGDSSPERGSSRNAHSSISHLNYTEQKTERMLAPSGIISPRKILKSLSSLFANILTRQPEDSQQVVKFYEEDSVAPIITEANELNRRKKEQLIREPFLIKDKLIFKRQTSDIIPNILKTLSALTIIFSPRFWVALYKNLLQRSKTLNNRDKALVGALMVALIILVVSVFAGISNHKTKVAQENFQKVIADINNKQEQVDSYLLYNNENGAILALNEADSLLKANSPVSAEQITEKESLLLKLREQRNKILKVAEITNFETVFTLVASSSEPIANSIILLKDRLYIPDNANKVLYTYGLKDASNNKISFDSALNLSSPALDGDNIYYFATDKIIKITDNILTSSEIGPEKLAADNIIQFYNNSLYLVSQQDNQIYKYKKSGNSYASRATWLKEAVGLNDASDLKIDISLWLAKSGGDPLELRQGKKTVFKADTINPTMRADKIMVTNKFIYLLDNLNKRLIVLNKNGTLNKQYLLNKEGMKDMAINEATKTAYILVGPIVYKFAL